MQDHHSPGELYITLVRRLHFLLPLSVLVPVFCQIITSGMDPRQAASASDCFMPLYFLTLTLALPAAFSYLMQEKAGNFGLFLIGAVPVSVLYLIALFWLEDKLSLSVLGCEQVPQALIVLAFLLDAIRMRTNDNSRRKAKAQGDHSWAGDSYLLPVPSLTILLPFALIYLAALFLHSHALAQVCLVGAILYYFLVLPYHVLVRRKAYLESRHSISRIPDRTIARLQNTAIVQMLLPAALIAAAALMTAGGRYFPNLPEFALEPLLQRESFTSYEQNALLRELIALGLLEKGTPPPQWLVSLLDFLENALTIILTVVLLYALWLGIRSLIRRFRREYAEDTAPSYLSRSGDEHVSLKDPLRKAARRQEENTIRRKYRRTILRFRGAPPQIYETPSMIEAEAQLPDTPAMHTLHEAYEKARYGNSSQSERRQNMTPHRASVSRASAAEVAAGRRKRGS